MVAVADGAVLGRGGLPAGKLAHEEALLDRRPHLAVCGDDSALGEKTIVDGAALAPPPHLVRDRAALQQARAVLVQLVPVHELRLVRHKLGLVVV